MSETKTKKEYQTLEIDASGKRIGRVATEAAKYLMGKNSPAYKPHQPSGNQVLITNAEKLVIPLKKQREKRYVSYSGYPGGKKEKTLMQTMADKGIEEVLRKAVYGMLPDNKLRKVMMKNLSIEK